MKFRAKPLAHAAKPYCRLGSGCRVGSPRSTVVSNRWLLEKLKEPEKLREAKLSRPALLAISITFLLQLVAPRPIAAQEPTVTPTPAKAVAGTKAIVLPPEKAAPVKLPRFDKPPVIDGKLDDEVWKQAVVLKDYYQVQPGDNIA